MLIQPLFIVPGRGIRRPISTLPGENHLSVDAAAEEAQALMDLGVRATLLFGLPEHKDGQGSGAFADDGIVQEAVRAIKAAAPDMTVITDTCLCEYTDHGHCGVLNADGSVENDPTLEILARTAVSQAAAGADVVAPSDMMDGRVGAMRSALDLAGLESVPIFSYASKYASAFYGPFRVAAESAPSHGDRRSYQMDPANAREAMREIELDLEEGADALILKPAISYLDIIHEARQRFDVPIAAYNVSGEFAMVKAAAAQGWLDERRAVIEILTGIARAGANMLITYHARDLAKWLREGLTDTDAASTTTSSLFVGAGR
jgi:porphobilinogen synthase